MARLVLAGGRAGVLLAAPDDGIGPGEATASGPGRANMAARAADLGCSFDLTAGPAGGTVLTWRVPL